MRLIQRWGSALAVVATAVVTVVCLAEMGPEELTGSSLFYGACCVLLAIAPPLAFGALSLRRDPSPEAALAQLLTTLGIAGYLSCSYLDVTFQAFGPHRHSSTESTVFILAPLAAFPLGAWVFALVWAVAKLISYGVGRTERGHPALSQAAESEPAQERAARGEVGRPPGQWISVALVLGIVLCVACFFVIAYGQEQAAKDPTTPPEALVRLAEKEKLQCYVAENPSTPPSTLVRLAALPDPVRTMSIALAGNPSTPPDVLCDLAELTPRPDTFDWEIRMRVEKNPSTPPAVAQALGRLHPLGHSAAQNWREWPKESQTDCAQF